MANKKKNLGKVVGRTNGLHIRQKVTKDGKTGLATSSEYCVYQGKNLVENGSGFKNKESAMTFADSLTVVSRKKRNKETQNG